MQLINEFLDKFVLPWPVRFLTQRFVILLTISLLVPLLLFANNQVLVLGINSYLNTMSVAVSSIVLLYATLSEASQKQIAEMQEKRAQEDHAHVTDTHQLLVDLIQKQQAELESIKAALAAAQGQTYTAQPAAQKIDLRELHPRGGARYEEHDVRERMDRLVHQHRTAETVRADFKPQGKN